MHSVLLILHSKSKLLFGVEVVIIIFFNIFLLFVSQRAKGYTTSNMTLWTRPKAFKKLRMEMMSPKQDNSKLEKLELPSPAQAADGGITFWCPHLKSNRPTNLHCFQHFRLVAVGVKA